MSESQPIAGSMRFALTLSQDGGELDLKKLTSKDRAFLSRMAARHDPVYWDRGGVVALIPTAVLRDALKSLTARLMLLQAEIAKVPQHVGIIYWEQAHVDD